MGFIPDDLMVFCRSHVLMRPHALLFLPERQRYGLGFLGWFLNACMMTVVAWSGLCRPVDFNCMSHSRLEKVTVAHREGPVTLEPHQELMKPELIVTGLLD